nr:peroxidase 10-like isoform X1 [Coffea arabica]
MLVFTPKDSCICAWIRETSNGVLQLIVQIMLEGIVQFDLLDKLQHDEIYSCPVHLNAKDYFIMKCYRLLSADRTECSIQGCDGSVLLDDTPNFKGEKNALPNRNSARGFEVIESIKADVERACPSIVSCADILALAAREAVILSEGPFWPVSLGRRDALTASTKAANEQLPTPFESLDNIVTKFASNGLDLRDVVVLSGAHTLGYAQCFTFKRRLFDFKGSGKPDPLLDASMVASLQGTCPNVDESNSKLAPLDVQTVYKFDNAYYKNLMTNTGLLESDQALMGNPKTAEMVNFYSTYPYLYSRDFAASMVKLGNIGVLTGQDGQIRKKCGSVNYYY